MGNTPYDATTTAQRPPAGTGQGPGYEYGPSGPGYGYAGPGYGYGPYGRRWGGQPRAFPIETKPFFLTSEFAAYLLSTIALIITAAVDNSIDAWKFWILESALTAAYLVSRGIAKSGTKSRSWDPREEMMVRAREGMDDRD